MEKDRSTRRDLSTEIEFFVDADVLRAETVNISETGIRFSMNGPIRVNMRFETANGPKECSAKLVWCKKMDDSGMNYGLEFIDSLPDEFINAGS